MMTRKTIRIGDRTIGTGHPAYVIAEIGSNHDSSLEKAKELIKASKQAGADAVKFQSFTAEGLFNPLKPGENGSWVAHPAYPVIERLTLPQEWHAELKDFSEANGITFLSAPFDLQRADLLESIGVSAYKIASGDLTFDQLIKKCARYKKPMIISTGAAYMEEVKRAVELIANEDNHEVAILHCSSLYPPEFEDVNLRSMVSIKETFDCPVGFSDHTAGSVVPVAAVALGASIIEKHITLSRKDSGPDHPYAMEADEFGRMVQDIRNAEAALGKSFKKPSDREMDERTGARRSIYAREDIKKGTVIKEDSLKLVRHAHGLEPRDLDGLLGMKAANDIKKDTLVRKEDICR